MEKVVREKLWTHSFCAVAAGNFLLFFAFYLLLPVLPMYLSEAFAASRSTARRDALQGLLITPSGL